MLSFAWWLSLAVGFLSLSQEILWVRIVSFEYGTLPHAFSFVLVNYLVGIALGAAVGKRVCSGGADLYRAAAVVLVVTAAFDAATPFLAPLLVDSKDYGYPLGSAVAIVLGAGLKSVLFPIAHQLGSQSSGPRLARSVSRIYFGNIAGATLGPLVTGYMLLDHLSVEQCFLLGALVSLVFAVGCAVRAGARRWAVPAAALVAVAVALVVPPPERGVLQQLADLDKGMELRHFLATKHGVVHTSTATRGGDYVLGGNIYDGRTSVDPDVNSNRLDRVYVLALVHPRPRRVLVVGMSTGAWTRALQGFPDVERIDVVEINPAYLRLIERYPEVEPVLRDPRVHVHVDDGRRWLKRNPDARFDLIVQNTTFHWRANSTNVLSREYMQLVRRHLAPGGVVTMNTTGSFDVLATAGDVFRHAYRYVNFVYASDTELVPVRERFARVLRADGRPFGDAPAPEGSVADRMRTATMTPVEWILARTTSEYGVITDENMLTEYRHGKRFGPGPLVALLPPPPLHFRLDSPPITAPPARRQASGVAATSGAR